MTWTQRNSKCPVPKANNDLILSNEYVDKTRALLLEFGEIPVIGFASFWYIKYHEVVDFAARRYNGGLTGFLKDNNHLFELKRDKEGVRMVSLISRPVSGYSTGSEEQVEDVPSDNSSVNGRESMEMAAARLLNPDNDLWKDKPWQKYLKKRDIYIARSPYELAHDIQSRETSTLVSNIRKLLSKHPTGVKSNQLYKHIDMRSALRIFGISISINSLIDELPELFYRQRMECTEEDLIFDGATHTIPNLGNYEDLCFDKNSPPPEIIVSRAISTGLYQKTLILINMAGPKGLKINVWMESIRRNFYPKNERDFEHDISNFRTMPFFLALAKFNRIELGSRSIKNDIRAFLPRQ